MIWYNVRCTIFDFLFDTDVNLQNALFAYGLFLNDKEKKIALINKNSRLPFRLLSYYKSKLWDSPFVSEYRIERRDNYNSTDYCCEGWEVKFSGYPDDISAIRLVGMTLLSEKYSLCGLSVGMDISECGGTLEKYGFFLKQNVTCNSESYSHFSLTELFSFDNEKSEAIDRNRTCGQLKKFRCGKIVEQTVWSFEHNDKIDIRLEFIDNKLNLIKINIYSEFVSGYEY